MNEHWEIVLRKLWLKSRFTSYFFQSVHFESDDTIPTLTLDVSTTGFTLRYHPDFPHTLNPDELTGLLAHEMMHVMLNHNHRLQAGKDVLLQNLAQDMVINSYLTENRDTFFSRKGRDLRDEPEVILPDGLPLIPDQFYAEGGSRDPYWESVYEWLEANRNQKVTEVTDKDKNGIGIDSRFQMPDFAIRNEEESEIVADLFQENDGVLFKSGKDENLPAGIHLFREKNFDDTVDALKKRILNFAARDENARAERLFQDISSLISRAKPARIKDFNKVVKRFLNQTLCGEDWDLSIRRFNRRYFAEGIYAPGRYYRKKPSLTVAVDVSGSMLVHPEILERAFGVIESLLGRYTVHLICIDEDVFIPERSGEKFVSAGEDAGDYIYRRGDWQFIRTAGNAATFFGPLFDRFMKNRTEPLIVLTDGDVYDMDRLTPYRNTLWAVPPENVSRLRPPFGKVAAIE